MKKLVALFLSLCLVLGCVAFASADGYTAGTYEATAQGFGGDVKVEITVDENAITDVKITGDSETPTVGGAALETLAGQIIIESHQELQCFRKNNGEGNGTPLQYLCLENPMDAGAW